MMLSIEQVNRFEPQISICLSTAINKDTRDKEMNEAAKRPEEAPRQGNSIQKNTTEDMEQQNDIRICIRMPIAFPLPYAQRASISPC